LTLTGTVTTSGSLTLGGTLDLSSPPTIGNTTPNTGAFTTLTTSSTVTLNGGTANGVAYLNGSKVLTTGSALTFNGTNLGVGATLSAWSASARVLQVGSAASFATSHNGVTLVSHNTYESAAAVFNYVASVGAQQYQQSAAGGHIWNTAPAGTSGDVIPFTTRMTLSTAGVLNVIGNIGVNAGSPAAPLDVRGSTNTLQARFGNVNTRGLEISTALTGGTNDATTILNALGAASGNLVLQTDSVERLRINQSGNVGIGTSSPANKLVVSNAGAQGFEFDPSNGIMQLFNRSTSAYGQMLQYASVIRFFTGASPTESMRIDSSGNVGIGTSSPTDKLEVIGAGAVIRTSSAASADSNMRLYGGAYTGNKATALVLTGTSTANNLIIGGGTSGGEPVTTISFVTGAVGTAAVGTTRLTIDANGNVQVIGGTLGYGAGSGGAVTQATSRTTGVTLNEPSGAITLVSAAGSVTYQSFTVTNSTVAATDTVIVCQKSGTDLYELLITAVAAGSFRISFKTTGGTTTEQPVFNFAVIKAATT